VVGEFTAGKKQELILLVWDGNEAFAAELSPSFFFMTPGPLGVW